MASVQQHRRREQAKRNRPTNGTIEHIGIAEQAHGTKPSNVQLEVAVKTVL